MVTLAERLKVQAEEWERHGRFISGVGGNACDLQVNAAHGRAYLRCATELRRRLEPPRRYCLRCRTDVTHRRADARFCSPVCRASAHTLAKPYQPAAGTCAGSRMPVPAWDGQAGSFKHKCPECNGWRHVRLDGKFSTHKPPTLIAKQETT